MLIKATLNVFLKMVERGWFSHRVLVVGDVMVDKYVWGDVTRISPEAPVPVILAAEQTKKLGGAANVAANLAGLGVDAIVVGFVGEDQDRTELLQLLDRAHVEAHLVTTPGLPTTSKTRVVGGHQQMLRLDVEASNTRPPVAYEALLLVLSELAGNVDAVVLSDYAKGVLIPSVCRHIINSSRERNIPVLVGPKSRDFERYAGASVICPNLQELSLATDKPLNDVPALLSCAQSMISRLGIDYFVVTMGEKGLAVVRPDSVLHVPARARQVFDVSGAGDTVLATIAAALLARLDIESASELANFAAGIVIRKIGTAPIDRYELLA